MFSRLLMIFGLVAVLFGGARAWAEDKAGVEFFETKIRPLLVDNCYRCHSANAPKIKGGLRLDSFEAMKRGGESGPAVVPGKVDDSLMISAVKWVPDGLNMPPKKELSKEQIALLEVWVKMGAPYPASAIPVAETPHPVKMTLAEGRTFWSFVPPKEQKVPAVNDGWCRNDIDRFVLSKLKEKNIKPAPEADRRTLIRRATYDLTGLPPTAAEIETFVNDKSSDAYEKLIDRLLTSPRYGEKWARHWLDIARYADTKGYMFQEERRYAFSYTYRDWVIRAFNSDLPYDQFLIDQIAADRVLAEKDQLKTQHPEITASESNLAGLGFLTLGRRFIGNMQDVIDDRIDVVCKGTLGLTVTCARCHDHKYDPISQGDYYSLYGIFASAKEPDMPPLLGIEEKNANTADYEKQIGAAIKARDDWKNARFTELLKEYRSREQVKRYLIAAQKGVATKDVMFDALDDGKAPNKWMVQRWEKLLRESRAKNDDVFAAWRGLTRLTQTTGWHFRSMITAWTDLRRANPLILIALIQSQPKNFAELADAYAVVLAKFDRAEALSDPREERIRQVLRGEHSPTAFSLEEAMHLTLPPDQEKLRGLQQAVDAIMVTHPGSPPRAMALEDLPTPIDPYIFKRGNAANPGPAIPREFIEILSPKGRQPYKDSGRLGLALDIASKNNPLTARVMVNRIWQNHFTFGLVRTPSDFGSRGDKPTHPELLDYLALKFENDGWSIKKIQKLIMMSATYRQASYGGDPNGEKVDPENRLLWHMNPRRMEWEELRDSLLVASGQLDLTMYGRPVDIFAEPFSHRRSIYAFIERQNLPGTFRTFDMASPDATTARRPNTVVPQQALYMMNSPFVIEQAKTVAGEAEKASEESLKLEKLYQSVFGREPTTDERQLALDFVHNEKTAPPPPPPPKTQWAYGYGQFDPAKSQVKEFHPLPYFTGSVWQGGMTLPDPQTGWAMLTATGGHPGNDQAHAVVRRWTAPVDCTVSIKGSLEHRAPEGDGIRARIITAADGVLATWNLHTREAETNISPISIKKDQTIDFVVDCRGSVAYDAFGWKIKIEKISGAAVDRQMWDATKEFTGPPPLPAMPMNAWERFAQVLLESNEFMFVD